MGTPFKMKGHTLPGPNQRKASPAKCPLVAAIIPALASAAAGAVVSGVVGAGKKKDAKKRQLIAKQAEAYKGLDIQA